MSAGPREAAIDLLASSGLNTRQLGAALGVVGRTFFNWATGSPVPERYQPRLQELHRLVFELDVSTPEERRRLLLSSPNGQSPYHRFMAAQPKAQRIHDVIPVRERLGL